MNYSLRDRLKDWQIMVLFWWARKLTTWASWCADWAEVEIDHEMKRTADVIKRAMQQAEENERRSNLH